MTQPKSFELGLVMAGAISAGAYTAGVVDFLLQALEEWEKEKENQRTAHGENYQNWSIPPHNALISVLSSASAGGIVAAILATALRAPLAPVETPQDGDTGNILYDSWVEKIDIRHLLKTHDLNGPDKEDDIFSDLDEFADETEETTDKPLAPVVSVLDSTILEVIRDKAMNIPASAPPRPYLNDPIQLFLTVSNLRGIPYRIDLRGANPGAGHDMWLHGDHVHFYLGSYNKILSDQGALHLDPAQSGAVGDWNILGKTTLATAAFPVGLAPRHLTRNTKHFNNRQWAVPLDTSQQPAGQCACWEYRSVKTLLGENTDFEFLNVDGGAANNEPLELARKAFKGHSKRNPRGDDEATRAVLMIDPFPDVADMETYEPVQNDLISTLKALIGTLKNQSRFKEDELLLALDETVFSRFVLVPLRYDTAGQPQKFAIASGSLGGFGGFGGFLSRAFREHDFFLGRRNCQRFLERYFALSPDNPLFADWSNALKSEYAISSNHNRLPIIPLLGRTKNPVPVLPWPGYTQKMLALLRNDTEIRLDAVVDRLIKTTIKSGIGRFMLKTVWWAKSGEMINGLMNIIKKELTKRGNMKPGNGY